jgi:hypothetical protein
MPKPEHWGTNPGFGVSLFDPFFLSAASGPKSKKREARKGRGPSAPLFSFRGWGGFTCKSGKTGKGRSLGADKPTRRR